jgi:hypothetical protein
MHAFSAYAFFAVGLSPLSSTPRTDATGAAVGEHYIRIISGYQGLWTLER